MEIMDETTGGLTVNDRTRDILLVMARWAKFLSILGFVGIAFMVVMGIMSGSMMNALKALPPFASMAGVASVAMTLYCLVLAVVYFFPVYYLYQFSVKTPKALERNDEGVFNYGLASLKNFFLICSVFVIIWLVCVLAALVVIAVGMMAM